MRKNVQVTPISTMAQLAAIQVISPAVSKKYVPIYSTDIVKILEPEFKFIGGTKFLKNGSEHYFDMVNEDGDQIRIFNSYNRSLALRVSLVSDGLTIDLGIDRLIHMGQRAKDFTETLTEAKDDIIANIATARILEAKLNSEIVTKALAKDISDIVFEHIVKGKGTYTNYVDILTENKDISIKSYIKGTLTNYYSGNYTYTPVPKDGKEAVKRNGQKTDSMLTKLKIENKIMKFLEDEYTEYFL